MILVDLIKYYYKARELKWPNTWEALGWTHTELGEVYELLLAEGNWVRNNPENKPKKFDKEEFAKELGDAIFMLMVCGITQDVDPLKAMEDKLKSTLQKLNLPQPEENEFMLTDLDKKDYRPGHSGDILTREQIIEEENEFFKKFNRTVLEYGISSISKHN